MALYRWPLVATGPLMALYRWPLVAKSGQWSQAATTRKTGVT